MANKVRDALKPILGEFKPVGNVQMVRVPAEGNKPGFFVAVVPETVQFESAKGNKTWGQGWQNDGATLSASIMIQEYKPKAKAPKAGVVTMTQLI